jgi:ABC-type glycerol-3-phosphate transport system substrate-binding protein
MKLKKFGLVLLFPMMLASCGGEASSIAQEAGNSSTSVVENTSSTSAEETCFIKEDTTISIWSTTGKDNKVFLDQFIEEFQKAEPHVTVENNIIQGKYENIKTNILQGFGANNYGDLVVCYPDHVADYINAGKAVDLTPYIENAEYGLTDKDDYYNAYIEEGQQYSIPGTYSLPYCASTEAMYYNYDVLKGLDLSDYDATINGGNPITQSYLNNLTWEEIFEHLAPAIKAHDAANPKSKLIKDGDNTAVLGYDSDDNLFITLCAQYGIPYTHINEVTGEGVFDFYENEEARNKLADILVKYNGYFKNGYITTQGVLKAYTNTLFTAQNSLFSVGSTAGVSHQFSTSNPMDVEVTSIPKAADGDLKTIKQGPSLCILSHGALGKPDTNEVKNRKLASWLLYKTITSAKNSTTWSLNTGYTPIRKSTKESKKWLEYTEYEDLDANTIDSLKARNADYTAQDKIQNSLFTSPAFLGSSTSRTAVGAALTQALQATSLDKAGALTILSNAYTEAKKAQ